MDEARPDASAPARPRPWRIGFMMDQVAGHVTNYHNLRRIADDEPDIAATWCEVSSYRAERRLERIRDRWLPFVPTYLTGNARAVMELARGLRAGPFDALFSNVRTGIFFSRRFAATPTLIDFDVTPLQLDSMEAYGGSTDPKPVAQFKWRLARRMFSSARVLQAWSNWAKHGVVEGYGIEPDKVVVNPPGVDLALWHPVRQADGRPPRVLFVGGDFRRKGGDILLDWHRQQRGVELHVVTRDEVMAGPDVFVHRGLQPNSPELLALYRDVDLFVLPSLAECFGIATVEAMAAGLPVIASNVGGVADIIEHGSNGFIVEPGDRNDLADAIDAVLSDPVRRAAMGQRSRQLAEAHFDVDRNARRTLAKLREIASERRPVESRPAPR